jgi:hypothetical protein
MRAKTNSLIHSAAFSFAPDGRARNLELMMDRVGSKGGAAARRGLRKPRESRAFPQCRQQSCGEIVTLSIGLADSFHLQSLPAVRAAEPRGDRYFIDWACRFVLPSEPSRGAGSRAARRSLLYRLGLQIRSTFRAFPRCRQQSCEKILTLSTGLADSFHLQSNPALLSGTTKNNSSRIRLGTLDHRSCSRLS